MIVLGIDQSYTCSGIVVMNNGVMIHHCIIETTPDDHGTVYERVAYICYVVNQLINEYRVELVCLEGIAFSANGRMADLGGLLHCLVYMVSQMSVKVSVVVPSALKKAVTGSGKASKKDMLNFVPEDDRFIIKQMYKMSSEKAKKQTGSAYDVADAYHLARVGSSYEG